MPQDVGVPPSISAPSARAEGAVGAAAAPAWLRQQRGWIVFALLLITQWLLFQQYVEQELAWAYPAHYDQAAYLDQTFQMYERMKSAGPVLGLKHALWKQSENGFMLEVQAACLFVLFGPSRLAALALNFLYFALFQGTLLATLRWLSGRWSVGFLGLGLLLSATTTFYAAGGLDDFRMDFPAFCLFGTFLTLVVRSQFFASRKVALAAALVASLLVLLRFLAVVYLAGILGVFLVCMLIGAWFQSVSPGRRDWAQRFPGYFSAVALMGLLTFPFLWHSRGPIWHYYYGGHVAGPERPTRRLEIGLLSWQDDALYYPASLCTDHLGITFGVIAGLAFLVPLVLLAICRRREDSAGRFGPGDVTRGALLFLLAFALPMAALTLNPTKNPVVANILIGPLVWLILLPLVKLTSGKPVARRALASLPLTAVALASIGAGIYVQAEGLCRHGVFHHRRGDVRQLGELYDVVLHNSQAVGWTAPSISTDSVIDSLHTCTMQAALYEKHRVWLDMKQPLGGGILGVTEAEALAGLAKSDFMILSSSSVVENQVFPFIQSIDAIRPKLRAVCERDFVKLRSFHVDGRTLTVYMRPMVRTEGESFGWITSSGMTLVGSGPTLRAFPVIRLQGRFNATWLGGSFPGVTAELEDGPPGSAMKVATSFQGDDYTMVVRLDPARIPDGHHVKIHLAFDRYFVPREVGINSDTRQLVIMPPTKVECLRSLPGTGPVEAIGTSFKKPGGTAP